LDIIIQNGKKRVVLSVGYGNAEIFFSQVDSYKLTLDSISGFIGELLSNLQDLYSLFYSKMPRLLLSPWVLKILRFMINYAHFYRVLPMRWKAGAKVVEFVEFSWDPFSRHVIFYLLGIYEAFLLIRCYNDIKKFKIEYFGTLIVELLFLFSVTLICVWQYFALIVGRLLVLAFNQYKLYFRQIERKEL